MCVCSGNHRKLKERKVDVRNMQEIIKSTKSIESAGQSHVSHMFLQISPIHGCSITYKKTPVHGVL